MLDVHPYTQGRALREMYSRLNDLVVDWTYHLPRLPYMTYLIQFDTQKWLIRTDSHDPRVCKAKLLEYSACDGVARALTRKENKRGRDEIGDVVHNLRWGVAIYAHTFSDRRSTFFSVPVQTT
jgi:hypothetical protein